METGQEHPSAPTPLPDSDPQRDAQDAGKDGRLTGKERLFRFLLGGGLVAIGCSGFLLSKAYDPANRAGVLAIAAVVIGMIYLGQAVRGRVEGPVHREEEEPTGPPIPVEKMSLGVFLGWLIPGAGHWMVGRRAKAILYFATISATFWIGVALAHGRNLNYDRDSVYFYAYVFNGVQTLIGWFATRNLELDHAIRFLQVGYLYAAVAALLNLVAMMDFVATCLRSHEQRIHGRTAPDTDREATSPLEGEGSSFAHDRPPADKSGASANRPGASTDKSGPSSRNEPGAITS